MSGFLGNYTLSFHASTLVLAVVSSVSLGLVEFTNSVSELRYGSKIEETKATRLTQKRGGPELLPMRTEIPCNTYIICLTKISPNLIHLHEKFDFDNAGEQDS